MRIRFSRLRGFTLLEIMIITSLIGLLATIALPTWVRARTRSQTNTCIHNLFEIAGAIQQCALETKKGLNAPVAFDDIKGYLKNSVACPAGDANATFDTTYELHGVGRQPTCLIAPDEHKLPPDNP